MEERGGSLPQHYAVSMIRQVATAFALQDAHPVALQPPGSPNRSVYRCVIESETGAFILEQVAAELVPRKREIAAALSRLSEAGLCGVLVPHQGANGDLVVRVGQTWWMATRHVPSDPLPRPEWAHDGVRGEALAQWLLQLREATGNWHWRPSRIFRLELWLAELVTQLRRRDPTVLARVRAPLRLAQEVLLQESNLPTAWAHGDLHPLNVLWQGQAVRAVIDWEFTGPKAELYDLANLIGCAGIEDPAALTGGLVCALTRWLHLRGILAEASWRALPAYVLALRFAWLAEWLRSDDGEMIELECDYLELLLASQMTLSAAWAG
mgnify:FL=1